LSLEVGVPPVQFHPHSTPHWSLHPAREKASANTYMCIQVHVRIQITKTHAYAKVAGQAINR
jgi:hypothetical protein